MTSPWLYLFALLLNIVPIGFHLYFTISYTDLSDDYINPIDLCNRLNPVQIPAMAVHMFMTLMFAVKGCWGMLLFNLPILVWNTQIVAALRRCSVQMFAVPDITISRILSKSYVLDATEIFRTLPKHQREAVIKLGFYVVMFFVYLYMMILRLASMD